MKTKIVIITLALLSLLLVACGSKESESEVPAIENETTAQEESTIEESVTEESTTETLEAESETMTEESITETSETETVPMTEESVYTISGIDKKMYVSQECDSFQEPYATSVIFAELNKGDLLHLSGEVVFAEKSDDNGVWYKFNIDGDEGYINAEYLTTEDPNAQPEVEVAQQPQSQPETSQPEQTQPQPEQTTPTQPTETTPQQTQPDTNIYDDDDSEVVINPETGQPAQSGDTWRDGNGFIVEYWENDEDLAQYGWY